MEGWSSEIEMMVCLSLLTGVNRHIVEDDEEDGGGGVEMSSNTSMTPVAVAAVVAVDGSEWKIILSANS